MFGLSARAVGFYAAFTFPLALFCAIPYLGDYVPLAPDAEHRRLRTARLLVLLAPIHLIFPLTALGMVRDASRLAEKPEIYVSARARLRAMAIGGCLIALAIFVGVAQAASG